LCRSQKRIAVAEEWGDFEIPEEGTCPPMEAVIRGMVKKQQNEKNSNVA
jgi:hypothetical protein